MGVETTPSNAQYLILALHSRITHSGDRMVCSNPDQPGARQMSFPLYYSLQLLVYLIFLLRQICITFDEFLFLSTGLAL